MPRTDPLVTYTSGVKVTDQRHRVPGRTDQVKNNAGGYVFAVDEWTRLHRFLIMGTTGGTYYVGERELTVENADFVINLIKRSVGDADRVLATLVHVSENGDAPKQNPTLFTLAAVATFGETKTRQRAFDMLPRVCRTGTMLFQFATYCKGMRGWGRAHKNAVANWYLRDPERVAYQAVKYRQREGWTHRDLLRLSHPKPYTDMQRQLFAWIVGKDYEVNGLPIVEAYEKIQREDVTERRVVHLVTKYGLPWEALPDKWMNSPAVWNALLDNIGLTALLRNLPRLTRIGVLQPMAALDQRIRRLANHEELRKARIHPVAVLNALVGYKTGVSRGGVTWEALPKVIDLLDDAFHASFHAIEPANKRTLVALDISGSMWGVFGGTIQSMPNLHPAMAAAAMAMATVRTEPEYHVMGFTTQFEPLDITAKTTLSGVLNVMHQASHRMGRTDCAMPMQWAERNRVAVDTFAVYTDNETWAGRVQPFQALKSYRQSMGINAREAVVGMTATDFTIADPTDAGSMDFVGFDAAMPKLLAEFSRGTL